MSTSIVNMKQASRPSLANAAFAGFLISGLGAASFYLAWIFIGVSFAMIVTLSLLCLTYTGYLNRYGKQKTGWLTLNLLLAIAFILGFALATPFVWLLALSALLVWIFRASKFYRSPFCALADLALLATGIVLGISTFNQTNSPFLSLWVFFLTQALMAFIPSSIAGRQRSTSKQTHSNRRFDEAAKNAQSALAQLNQY